MFKDLQSFVESTVGQVAIICVIVLLFLLILIPQKKDENKKVDVKALTVSALMVALALALGLVKIFEMPQGGSVTLFSMLPIALVGYLFGVRKGVMAGICLGLLNLIFGPYVIHPAQLLLDYPLAFGALGLGGVFKDMDKGLVLGYVTGVVGRYLCAFLSGVIFFAEYTPEGFNPYTWSLWYNFTYLAPEMVATVVILSIPMVKNGLDQLKTRL